MLQSLAAELLREMCELNLLWQHKWMVALIVDPLVLKVVSTKIGSAITSHEVVSDAPQKSMR